MKNFGNNTVMILLIAINFLFILQTAKDIINNDLECLSLNTRWEFLNKSKITIQSSLTCTQISNKCCHISINYKYDEILFDNSYCALLSGDISSWQDKFTNMYQDELMWYADFAKLNNQDISIGNNLNYKFNENFTCSESHPQEDYSTFPMTNCAYTRNGTCAVQKDEKYVDEFIAAFYKNITSNWCNNINPITGKCVGITNKDNPNSNNSAIIPLFNQLNASFSNIGNLNEKMNNNSETLCKPVPKVTVKITCPESYVSSYYYIKNNLLFYFLIVILYFI